MRLLVFLVPISFLFAASSDVMALTGDISTAYPVIYPIDASTRGSNVISTFTALKGYPYNTKTTYEIAITTISNGKTTFVPFVNNIAQTSFNTLLIVSYRLQAGGDEPQNKYIVVPIENFGELIYSTNTITKTAFSFVNTKGIIPYFPIDAVQRAKDIQSAVNTLNNTQPYKKTGAWPNVSLSTTLRGTYNGQELNNGLIPLVTSVTPYGALMIVSYQFTVGNNIAQYIVVPAEQVLSINYLRNQ